MDHVLKNKHMNMINIFIMDYNYGLIADMATFSAITAVVRIFYQTI